jgi:hypothetical protein
MRSTNRDLRLKTEEVVGRGIRYWCRDTSQPDAAYGVPRRHAALARVSYQMTWGGRRPDAQCRRDLI